MRIKYLGLAVLISVIIGIVGGTVIAHANSHDTFDEPTVIRCTVYDDVGYTKSGQWVRDGIIAGKKECLGSVAALWAVKEDGTIGELVGYYEVVDTGGEYIQNGERVDVWTSDPIGWVQEHGDYVYMQIIEGVG